MIQRVAEVRTLVRDCFMTDQVTNILYPKSPVVKFSSCEKGRY